MGDRILQLPDVALHGLQALGDGCSGLKRRHTRYGNLGTGKEHWSEERSTPRYPVQDDLPRSHVAGALVLTSLVPRLLQSFLPPKTNSSIPEVPLFLSRCWVWVSVSVVPENFTNTRAP